MSRFSLIWVLASLGCGEARDAQSTGSTSATVAELDVGSADAVGAATAADQLAPLNPARLPLLASSLPILGPSLFGLDLDLEDQSGRRVTTASLRRGGPLIISMFYASCSYACPTLIRDLANVDRALDPIVRAQTRVLLITFDPGHDTPEVLSRLATAHGTPPDRWAFARAKDDNATREIAAALGITYRRLPDNNFNHSSVLLLLDTDGVPRAEVQGLAQDTRAFVAAISALAHDRPAAAPAPVRD